MAKPQLNTASQEDMAVEDTAVEDTVAEDTISTHPNTTSTAAVAMTSTHLSTMSKGDTEPLGSTHPSKEITVSRLAMADQAMELHQTLLRDSTATTRHLAALETTTTTNTISMAVPHNTQDLNNTSKVTEGLLNMARATAEHRSLAGNSLLEL